VTATQQTLPPRRTPKAASWRGQPVVAFLRNTWRGLTSMRTALILLFLLALASLPVALLPQWSLNQSKTAGYIRAHPGWAPWLNRLGFFEVFASPWYSAIYLLLFISLIGCLGASTSSNSSERGRWPHHAIWPGCRCTPTTPSMTNLRR